MKDSENLLFERLDDLIRSARDNYTPGFTKFLDSSELVKAKEYVSGFKNDIICVCFGGFENAERCVVGLFPKSVYEFSDKSELYKIFGLECLHICGSGYRELSHRDFLGSILSLGVKRETVGEILVSDDKFSAYAVFLQPVGSYVLSELESVANDKVKCITVSHSQLPEIRHDFVPISATVASLRLDCVLAEALKTSREKAKRLIDSKCVSVNHAETQKCDTALSCGDLLSVRGHGRFALSECGEVTKKGRIKIIIKKFV